MNKNLSCIECGKRISRYAKWKATPLIPYNCSCGVQLVPKHSIHGNIFLVVEIAFLIIGPIILFLIYGLVGFWLTLLVVMLLELIRIHLIPLETLQD